MTDIPNFPVMPRRCPTCPFRTDERDRYPDKAILQRGASPLQSCRAELVAKIQQRCLSEASQICHHPRLQGKAETHLCRGARDFQIEIFYRLGVLDAPTDEAWRQKWERSRNKRE